MGRHGIRPGSRTVLGTVRQLSIRDNRTDLHPLRERIIDDREREGLDVSYERATEARLRADLNALEAHGKAHP